MAILPQNAIMFSHNDLDGIGGGILFKAALGSYTEVHYCSYQNVDDKINQRLDELENSADLPFILIADLGIKEETAERLDRYQGGKRWLDHHKTNIELASRFDWATIEIQASGTLLVFDEFENIPRSFRDFAILVDDYDRWIHAYPDSKQLNRLFFIVGIKKFEDRCLMAKEPHRLYNIDKILLELEEERINHYIDKLEKSITVYELTGEKRFGVGFAERYQSEAAHELMNRLELDAIALIDVNLRKVSFRSKPKLDVGSIAKRLGGGGHKNAAGAEFNYGRIDDFHGSKFPLFGVYQNLQTMIFELFWKFKRAHEEVETEAITKMFKGELK
jgi:uncharacterized protein